jgi:hypothetical protein
MFHIRMRSDLAALLRKKAKADHRTIAATLELILERELQPNKKSRE